MSIAKRVKKIDFFVIWRRPMFLICDQIMFLEWMKNYVGFDLIRKWVCLYICWGWLGRCYCPMVCDESMGCNINISNFQTKVGKIKMWIYDIYTIASRWIK
jgi:hypothetical protein